MGVICSCLTFCFFCVKTKERTVVLAQLVVVLGKLPTCCQLLNFHPQQNLTNDVCTFNKPNNIAYLPMLFGIKNNRFFSQKHCVLSYRSRYETYGHTRHHQIAAAYYLRGPLLSHRHASHTPERACFIRCPPLKNTGNHHLQKGISLPLHTA